MEHIYLLVSFNILWYGRCRCVCIGLTVVPKDESLATVYQILQWKTLTFLADVLLSYGGFFLKYCIKLYFRDEWPALKCFKLWYNIFLQW